MQTPTKEWIHKAVDGLPDQETEQLKDYLEFLTWKAGEKKSSPEQRQKKSDCSTHYQGNGKTAVCLQRRHRITSTDNQRSKATDTL